MLLVYPLSPRVLSHFLLFLELVLPTMLPLASPSQGYESGVEEDEEGPFPPGWVMYTTDEPVPRRYYFHEGDNKTIWERPR